MILMYHHVVPELTTAGLKRLGITVTHRAFDSHINWLKKKYHLISLKEYLESGADRDSRLMAITLDDGHGPTYTCARDVALKHKVPMTIFVSTCQIDDGPLIWGMYINALSTEQAYASITLEGVTLDFQTSKSRLQSRQYLLNWALQQDNIAESVAALAAKYPIPERIMAHYRGMTTAQLSNAAREDIINIGSHTVTHPFLANLKKHDLLNELESSKRTLENLTGKPVDYIAYPSGSYNSEVIDASKDVGYKAGLAVSSQNRWDADFEIPRLGIYRSNVNLLKLSLARHAINSLIKAKGN